MASFQRALPASDLPVNAKRAVMIDGVAVLLCNVGGRLHAVSNICSHADEKLDCGRLGNGWIACPVHGARFDLATGAARNPPATRPIAVYEVRAADEWIEVAI
jgi:3-phenylpropionate/trans-cinnamate dioxygenase ferredoxin subunit